ncbi:phosphatidylserine decarboxylase [Hominifimenecus sp. rT4P-3]|uniref:phosphatidylserine decarboxylase n=1 Tax=Hominifimenecus sp. rT4P-3 TaxID=3242979 RepID=UPI003DA49324
MLTFLYHTPVGRCFLKVLTKPALSNVVGRFLDLPVSRPLIPGFIRKNQLDLSDYRLEDWPCFNDFFTRRLKDGVRPVDQNPEHLIAPCDGLLTAYPVDRQAVFSIKDSSYTVYDLLRSRGLAEAFLGGTCLIFRLTPSHYHRYCYPDSGKKSENRFLPGILHTVQPVATEACPVYRQNSREYTVLRTEHFGDMVMMEVGAMLVGRICNEHPGRMPVLRGQEKGRFEFGGSTIILLLQKGTVEIREDILAATERNEEFPIRLGEPVGSKPKR